MANGVMRWLFRTFNNLPSLWHTPVDCGMGIGTGVFDLEEFTHGSSWFWMEFFKHKISPLWENDSLIAESFINISLFEIDKLWLIEAENWSLQIGLKAFKWRFSVLAPRERKREREKGESPLSPPLGREEERSWERGCGFMAVFTQ